MKNRKIYSGRLSREQWILGFISVLVIAFVFNFFILDAVQSLIFYSLYVTLRTVLIGVAFIFIISLHVRRLHDLCLSGRWLFLLLVPVINGFLLLSFLILPGKEEENKFGKRSSKEDFFRDIFVPKQ